LPLAGAEGVGGADGVGVVVVVWVPDVLEPLENPEQAVDIASHNTVKTRDRRENHWGPFAHTCSAQMVRRQNIDHLVTQFFGTCSTCSGRRPDLSSCWDFIGPPDHPPDNQRPLLGLEPMNNPARCRSPTRTTHLSPNVSRRSWRMFPRIPVPVRRMCRGNNSPRPVRRRPRHAPGWAPQSR
jgi:hypothetical protein